MYNYINLDLKSTERFLEFFGKDMASNGYLDHYREGEFFIKNYVRTAYQKLLNENISIKSKYQEILSSQKHYGETFFAFKVDEEMFKSLTSSDNIKAFLGKSEISDDDFIAYKEAFETLVDNLNNNYIKFRRKSDRNSILEPTPLSFYDYKGYNDNTPPD